MMLLRIASLPKEKIVILLRHGRRNTKTILSRGWEKKTLGEINVPVRNRGSVSTVQTEMKTNQSARYTGPADHVLSLHPL